MTPPPSLQSILMDKITKVMEDTHRNIIGEDGLTVFDFAELRDALVKALSFLIDEEKEKSELIGVGKILDCLWDNSYYSMGKLGADRIEQEMIYYFGKDWAEVMHKVIAKNGMQAQSVKPLKDFTKEQRKALVTNHLEEK